MWFAYTVCVDGALCRQIWLYLQLDWAVFDCISAGYIDSCLAPKICTVDEWWICRGNGEMKFRLVFE